MLIHDTDPTLPIPPFERESCGLCGIKLTPRNCKWRVFPGVCLNCAPLGICGVMLLGSGRGTMPVGFQPIRQCRCGRPLGQNRTVCARCKRLRRRRIWRVEKRRQRNVLHSAPVKIGEE